MRGSVHARGHRFGAAVAALALAGTVVAGLATTAGAAPLTESQFKKQADAVCKQGNKETDALGSQYFADLQQGQEPDAATIAAFVADFVPLIQSQIDDIDNLQEPKKLKKKVSKFLSTAQDELDALEADPSLLASESVDPFADTVKVAKQLGLKQCAS